MRGAALLVAIVVAGKGPLGLDAGRAAQNMMLAAHNDGHRLVPERDGRRRRDGRAPSASSEGEQVATVLSFGYPARPRDPERRTPEEWIARANRKPFDDVVSER